MEIVTKNQVAQVIEIYVARDSERFGYNQLNYKDLLKVQVDLAFGFPEFVA